MNFSKSDCDKWKKNKTTNPKTGRTIKIDGPTFKKIQKECLQYSSSVTSDLSTNRKSNKSSSSSNISNIATTSINNLTTLSSNLKTRIELTKLVVEKFKHLIPNQKGCISSKSNNTLLTHFKNVTNLGSGSFGFVRRALLNDVLETPLAIKEVKGKPTKKNPIPVEYALALITQKALYGLECPSFIFLYFIAYCDDCNIDIETNKSKKPSHCYILGMELANFTLNVDYLYQGYEWSNLFQMLSGLDFLQKYGIVHNDIKKENILVKQNSTPNGIWEYIIDNKKYYIPNNGFTLCITDLGASKWYHPKATISNNDLGERNFKVIGNDLYPFTSKYYMYEGKGKNSLQPNFPNTTWVNWEGKTTLNHFFKGKNIEPSIEVDLANFFEFPASYFAWDVADVLRIFIGGQRTSQSGNHRTLDKTRIDKKFWNIVKLNDNPNKYGYTFSQTISTIGTAKYFLARKMIVAIFSDFTKIQPNIVERFDLDKPVIL
jgi:serine/threonine protein kinase